jgi:hypothetical protein
MLGGQLLDELPSAGEMLFVRKASLNSQLN